MDISELIRSLTGGVDPLSQEHAMSAEDLLSSDGPTEIADSAVKLDGFDQRQARESVGFYAEAARASAAVGEDGWADFLAAAFRMEPQVNENVVESVQARRDFLASLLESPDYVAMHTQTALDPGMSVVAAAIWAERFSAANLPPPPPPSNGTVLGDRNAMEYEWAVMEAARQALAASSDAIEQAESLGLAAGFGAGEGRTLTPGQLLGLVEKMKSQPRLRAVMELLGRYSRLAESCQRGKPQPGASEACGIERGNNVSRTLASELAMLSDDDLELEFYRRFAERGLMQYRRVDVPPAKKGPIVVLLDESGSMDGDPINNAKALAAALMWVARRQKRDIHLIGFDDESTLRELVAPRGAVDADKLVDWLCGFLAGGTNFEVPLRRARELCTGAWKTADILMVTDGYCGLTRQFAEDFSAWKKRSGTRLITVVVGGGDVGSMERVSDRVERVPVLSAASEAVRTALSI